MSINRSPDDLSMTLTVGLLKWVIDTEGANYSLVKSHLIVNPDTIIIYSRHIIITSMLKKNAG